MEYKADNKRDNLIKVESAVKSMKKYFTITDIINKTGLNHMQCNKYLISLIDFKQISYSDTSKLYMKHERF